MKILTSTENLKDMRQAPDMPSFASHEDILNMMTNEARKKYLKSLKKNKKKNK